MNVLSVDQTKCSRDGLCAMECPMGIIRMNGDGPEAVQNDEKLCIRCGHCVSICPHGALSLQTMPAEHCQPLPKDWKLSPTQMEHVLKGRRSVRVYQQKEAPRETLEQILDLARYAPSAKNFQPIHWIVIQKPERVRELAGLVIDWMRAQVEARSPIAKLLNFDGLIAAWENGDDAILRSAPHLIVTHAPQAARTAIVDASIALTYAELAATSFDLGTCWAGFFHMASIQSEDLQTALGLPEQHQCTGTLMLGYPKLQHQRIPLRNELNVTWN